MVAAGVDPLLDGAVIADVAVEDEEAATILLPAIVIMAHLRTMAPTASHPPQVGNLPPPDIPVSGEVFLLPPLLPNSPTGEHGILRRVGRLPTAHHKSARIPPTGTLTETIDIAVATRAAAVDLAAIETREAGSTATEWKVDFVAV